MKKVFEVLKQEKMDFITIHSNCLFFPFSTTFNWEATAKVHSLLLAGGVIIEDIEIKRIDLLHAQGFIICQTSKVKAIQS